MNGLLIPKNALLLIFVAGLWFAGPGTCAVRAQTAELVFVDEQPRPAGGLDAFYRYVADQVKYPEEARRSGIQGRVFVQFVVDPSGTLSAVQVERGIGGGCDEEAVRLVKAYPAGWQPAKAGGKPVTVQMSLPIRFVPAMAQAGK